MPPSTVLEDHRTSEEKADDPIPSPPTPSPVITGFRKERISLRPNIPCDADDAFTPQTVIAGGTIATLLYSQIPIISGIIGLTQSPKQGLYITICMALASYIAIRNSIKFYKPRETQTDTRIPPESIETYSENGLLTITKCSQETSEMLAKAEIPDRKPYVRLAMQYLLIKMLYFICIYFSIGEVIHGVIFQ